MSENNFLKEKVTSIHSTMTEYITYSIWFEYKIKTFNNKMRLSNLLLIIINNNKVDELIIQRYNNKFIN